MLSYHDQLSFQEAQHAHERAIAALEAASRSYGSEGAHTPETITYRADALLKWLDKNAH